MNERPTPETDARTYIPVLGASTVPAEFARKLERERDEAREKYDNLATEHMLAINKLCNERDEAREALRTLAEHGEKEMQTLQNALMEIEDRCVDCEDACDDIQKIREITVKALEAAK